MNPKALSEAEPRVWYFAHCELDELQHELRVKGARVELESKPLDLLLQLVIHAGEVVTKEELLETVWAGSNVVDGSLPTAISKLRKVLDDQDTSVIVTVPRVGYRLGVPAVCKIKEPPSLPELAFEPGDCVPGRDQWFLMERLGQSHNGAVWLAQHSKTHERRVFKFALNGVGLKALKREATLSRYLLDSTGPAAPFVRVLEWNFDTAPFHLESEYGGRDLGSWAERKGSLANTDLQVRLRILIEVARAVAIAHDLGVLHKDLKPANILLEDANGHHGLQVRVADFGIASLLEPSRLHALQITNLGFTQTEASPDSSRSGTLLYLAPEVILGQTPTASGDIYALGVMLYQLITGDLRRPLAPGWEADVDDPLLQQDIADAACGDRSKRIGSAGDLAERLASLEVRRTQRRELQLMETRAAQVEKRLAKAKARRPWMLAAAAALVLGSALSLLLFRNAVRERDRANRQAALVSATNRFLADDLLAEADPLKAREAGRSFIDAVKDAAPHIDAQFQSEPIVAANLHAAVARALDSRFDVPGAVGQYSRARALFIKGEGPQSQNAVASSLRAVSLEARSNQAGAAVQAKTLLADAERAYSKIENPRPEVSMLLFYARGFVAIRQSNALAAVQNLTTALKYANADPGIEKRQSLLIERALAFSEIHAGKPADAETRLRRVIEGFLQLEGPDSPYAAETRMSLGQAFLSEHKFPEAVRETTQVYPVLLQELGEYHEMTLQILATRAAAEGGLRHWDDAIRDDLLVYSRSLHKHTPSRWFTVSALSDAAMSECKVRNFREGETKARQAHKLAVELYGSRDPLTGGTAYSLASCLVGRAQWREAADLLHTINVSEVEQLSGDPSTSSAIALLQTETAVRLNDFTSARQYLKSAAPILNEPDADPVDLQLLRTLTLALGSHPPRVH